MDILGWLWWAVASSLALVWSVVWFLISGWVSTLLQIAILIFVIYTLKYGWRRAPVEIWRRTRSFGAFFWSWLRAGSEPGTPQAEVREVIVRVRAKEFGDVNLSTLLSLVAATGILLLSQT